MFLSDCRAADPALLAQRWEKRSTRRFAPPTLGIELELMIVDSNSGGLADGSRRLLRACADDGLTGIDAEFMQSMIEVKTSVCDDVAQAEAELRPILARLRVLARRLGYDLASCATHPFSRTETSHVFPRERYRQLANSMGAFAAQGLLCGLHVHIGVDDGEAAIGLVNLLLPYLPHLTALSANSPFWRGSDTRMASSRLAHLAHYPSAGLPPPLSNWQEFLSYERQMRDAGVIGSLKDLYWDIRPRPDLGTVEVRICDAPPSLEIALGLAAFIRGLGVSALRALEANRTLARHFRARHWMASENRRLAARYGLAADYIGLDGRRRRLREVLTELMDEIAPVAVELGDGRFLGALLPVADFECGSERQRRVYRATENMGDVINDLMNQLPDQTLTTDADSIPAHITLAPNEKEKFMSPNTMITDLDRRRLGTLLDQAIDLDAIHRRYLSDLELELERATTIDATEVPPDVVTMNSTVELSDLETGETTNYTLVYPDEADVQKNRISVLAPVGTAILGYRVGDVIRCPAPDGVVRIRIDNVLYQPERVGDFWR